MNTFRLDGWKYVDNGGVQLWRIQVLMRIEEAKKTLLVREPLSLMEYKIALREWEKKYTEFLQKNSNGIVVARWIIPKIQSN